MAIHDSMKTESHFRTCIRCRYRFKLSVISLCSIVGLDCIRFGFLTKQDESNSEVKLTFTFLFEPGVREANKS